MKITIKKYYYNISNEKDRIEYEKLCAALKSRGLKLLDFISAKNNTQIDGDFELETEFIFSNQFNAGNYRCFDWCGFIYPNRNIKTGHYAADCPGFDYLQQLRHTTRQCGYCGKLYRESGQNWCNACLGSQYLELKELRLLKTHFIDQDRVFDENPPDWLVIEYEKQQKSARLVRVEKDKQRALAKCRKDRETAEIEYKGFILIIESGLDYDNCIYYTHTGRFCFGWRKPLTEVEKIEIGDKLKKFPYDYDMK